MATRPPRKQRSDGERSRRAILRAAATLATVDGLEGLSIGHLADHIGISKSGLYAHFGSKEELQLATVDTAAEIFNSEVIEPTEGIADPLERIRAICEAFLDHLERRVFPGGCFFISVGAEFDTHPGAVKNKITGAQKVWAGRMEGLIREAQAAGSIDAAEDPAQLAFDLDAPLLLGNTLFVLHDEPRFLRSAKAAITRRLELAAAPTLARGRRPRRAATAT